MRRALCTAAVAFALIASAQPAYAQSDLSPSPDRVLETSPAGCKGYTDYPHKSGNDASVHGRTNCNYSVSSVSVTTTLKRDRWYGLQTLASDPSSRTNSSRSYDATPHWYCYGTGTYTYKAYSSHTSVENGRTYYASTWNWQDPGVSRFNC